MRRGRGKGKKQNLPSSREDPASGEEEKVPAYRRRGRPQKPPKNDIEEEEMGKLEEKDDDNANESLPSKDIKSQVAKENGRKRKRSVQSKDDYIHIKEEDNGISGSKSSTDDFSKPGYRQNGSRRKNKPRRAAEAVVECNEI